MWFRRPPQRSERYVTFMHAALHVLIAARDEAAAAEQAAASGEGGDATADGAGQDQSAGIKRAAM